MPEPHERAVCAQVAIERVPARRTPAMTAPKHGLALLLVSIAVSGAVFASAASPPFQASKLSVKSAVNQKAFETWAVKGTIIEQFIRCCLPPPPPPPPPPLVSL